MTLWQIYKAFKHGEDLYDYSLDKLYRALKKHELQVVIVNGDVKGKPGRKLYNYIEETDSFELVTEEQGE